MPEPTFYSSLGATKYERRIRAFWTAEPQRGNSTHYDDEARLKLSRETSQLGLDYWAKSVDPAPHMPKPGIFRGPYFAALEWFDTLGLSIVAFPNAKLRNKFVAMNKATSETIPDDAFWP